MAEPFARASILDRTATHGTPNQILTIYIFAVSDLETYCARVRAQPGSVVGREIETQPWGEHSFYCSDPFGNKLCFVDDPTLFTADLL